MRDGKEAVEHATEACKLTNWKNTAHLDTLAAAYAETGDFERAIEYQKKVVTDAAYERQYGAAPRERLTLYVQMKPYRDPEYQTRAIAPPPRRSARP